MAQSLVNFDAALKNLYGPGLKNALNNSNPILTEVVHDTLNVSGRKCIWNVHSGRSGSTGARSEGAALPIADRQRYIAPEETLAYLYHTIKVTGQALNLTQNNAGAFGKALDQEMKGAEKDIKVDLARQMFNDVVTINSTLVNGALAEAESSTSTVISVEDPYTADTAIDPTFMRYFFVGQTLDAVTPASGVITVSNMTVTAVDKTNKTVTVDDTTGIQAEDLIFRHGNFKSTTTENEINGLGFLTGTNNYASITASSNPVWNGLSVGSTSVGISEDLLESAKEAVLVDGDGSDPELAIGQFKQGRKLAGIVQQQKRYQPPKVTLEAGWKGIEVAGLNFVFDRFAPERKIYVLTPSELAWFVGLDWSWNDDAGYTLGKALDGTDAIEANYRAYVQLNTYTRNAHAVVTLASPVFA
jgi:hypothetical protein